MKLLTLLTTALVTAGSSLFAQTPANMVAENVPPIPEELTRSAAPYMEFRSANLSDWHPTRRELLISTRFASTPQLHSVAMPGGARRQLTFFDDRVGGGSFDPANANVIVFAKDVGGGEFFQLYRFDHDSGNVTLLTDGKSRNTGMRWATSGGRIAYSSTRRTGRDTDIYVMNVMDPASNRMAFEVKGGGWSVGDWSPDDAKLAIIEAVSANESYIHLADLKTGQMTRLTPKTGERVSYDGAEFSADGKSIYTTSDEGSEFSRLTRIDLATGRSTVLTPNVKWDVGSFELSHDGALIAYVTNEAGYGVLHLLDVATGRELPLPKLPAGVIGGLDWRRGALELGFNVVSARTPSDVFSYDVDSGNVARWTESETGGLDASKNAEPELVKMKSFDDVEISAFVYRPDAGKFPGKRPSIIIIHGGPEGQSRPTYLGRNNYLINELGIALVIPNVRGSSGYGKTFLALDNGIRREDSVRDIGRVIEWIGSDARLDRDRIGVTGGSYGGYMTLAALTHYSDRLRAGIDVVGISSFLTFLKNTQGYRRDLRRVEYGDERDAAVRDVLERISPLNNAAKIKKPLFVVQGFNDPRVPYTEAEQIAKAVRENKVPVWFLMAKDEGHGFAKKPNQDYQFLASLLFWRQYLLQ